MKITVEVFGRYRDIIGKKELDLSVSQGATILDVVTELVRRYPQFEKDKKFFLISRNKIYTTTDAAIEDGDVITLSPPIVGGG